MKLLIMLFHLLVIITFGTESLSSDEVVFIKPLKNKTVTEGQDVTIRCDTTAYKGVTKSWTHYTTVIFANGNKLLADRRIALLSDSSDEYSMQVKNVSLQDEGLYTCTLYPQSQSQSIGSFMYLTVNIPPEVTEATPDLEVDEGTNVMLKCSAEGKPQPRITWRHLIPSADDVRGTSEYLPLGSVSRSSGGTYECSADNDVLTPAKKNIRVTVNYPPEIESDMIESYRSEPLGKSISLECAASAVPEPKFTWFHHSGKLIQKALPEARYRIVKLSRGNSIRSKLFLSKLLESDYGNYSCEVKNKLGHSNYTIVLQEKKLPFSRPPPQELFRRNRVSDSGRGGATRVTFCQWSFLLFSCSVVLVTSTSAIF